MGKMFRRRSGAAIQTGRCLRQLFASILLYCEPRNVLALWLKFKNTLCEDIEYRVKSNTNGKYHDDLMNDIVENAALLELQELSEFQGKSLTDFGLPPPLEIYGDVETGRIILD